MRRTLTFVSALGLALCALSAHAADRGKKPARRSAAGLHPLRRSEARRAAPEDRRGGRLPGTPAMNLKKDENYAGTAEDREPFAGTKPYKENFLLQMEYIGPRACEAGTRAPRHREGRLHRSDHGDRLGGDGRQEPRGSPRGPDAAGLAPRRRGVERARRLPEAQDPVRAGRQQRQRPLGLVGQRDHQAGLQRERLGHPRHDRRRQQPHRDPRRAQGRGADDQQRRHRPDLHRDEHPLGRARDRRRPAAGLPAHRLLVPQAELQARGDHPGEQPLRPLRRARDHRQRAAAREAGPGGDGLQGRAEGLQAASWSG